MNDEQAIPVADCHHFQQHAVLIRAEKHEPVVAVRALRRRWLGESVGGVVDDVAAADAADAVASC